MTRLSVNINKVALIRNARGGNLPNLLKFAVDCENYGAQGITVHPRPDERHIRYQDVKDLKKVLTTELNVEGNPTQTFIDIVCKIKPDQVTLVPDAPEALTSNNGWDTITHRSFLSEVISEFKNHGIRVSIFINPEIAMIESAKHTGCDRIELYTESYAKLYSVNRELAIKSYYNSAIKANELSIGINAGHDLNLTNLQFFKERIPSLCEVSIGHALISDALYFGIENTIQLYHRQLT